jgi:hypothetical protein
LSDQNTGKLNLFGSNIDAVLCKFILNLSANEIVQDLPKRFKHIFLIKKLGLAVLVGAVDSVDNPSQPASSHYMWGTRGWRNPYIREYQMSLQEHLCGKILNKIGIHFWL